MCVYIYIYISMSIYIYITPTLTTAVWIPGLPWMWRHGCGYGCSGFVDSVGSMAMVLARKPADIPAATP